MNVSKTSLSIATKLIILVVFTVVVLLLANIIFVYIIKYINNENIFVHITTFIQHTSIYMVFIDYWPILLIINSLALMLAIIGALFTSKLIKKTYFNQVTQELTSIYDYTDVLQTNNHEFMNQLHTILGMLEIKAYSELRTYIQKISSTHQETTSYITKHIANPVLSGFIIGKIKKANELGIELILSDDSYTSKNLIDLESTTRIILILGNLITNSFEALEQKTSDEKIVFLTLRTFEKHLLVIVEDSGTGIDKNILPKIFTPKASTKGANRGLGLYILKQTVNELNGSIEVDTKLNEGTVFTVKLNLQARGD